MAKKIFDDKGAKLVDMPVMPKQADSTATTVAEAKADINALLKKLQDAGYMAS